MHPGIATLERLKSEYGRGAAERKRALLRALGRADLGGARAVARFHEILCWLRAYPDDRGTLALVERLLVAFPGRRDLRRNASALADSGIAGTPIRYRFFYRMAVWLAERWPRNLRFDWEEFEHGEELETLLPLLGLQAEQPGLDELPFDPRRWLAEMRGSDETDAAFLARRVRGLPVDEWEKERLYDRLDPPMRIEPGPGTPSRTFAKARVPGIRFQKGPLRRERPALPGAILEPPRSIRAVGEEEGAKYVEMAREAMVTRSRDLDAFVWGDPRDVRIADCGDGLQFVVIGMVPERRLLLEAVYAFLTLKNGVPIGYVLVSAIFGSSEVAYNVFETYRGGEAGHVYGRVLATTRAIFGSDAFTIYPYQLGDDNEEAIESGAWWFYQKLGFRPRDRRTLALMRRELARMRLDPAHRSSASTLRRLARENVYYFTGRPRTDVIGLLPLMNLGLRATRYLARRFGSRREEARDACARELAEVLGFRRTLRGGGKLAFERWGPLLLSFPEIRRWSPAEKRALSGILLAKGGRRESDYARLLDGHARLRALLVNSSRSRPGAARRS